MTIKRNLVPAVVMAAGLILSPNLPSCSSSPDEPARIRAVLDRAAALTEKKDLDRLMDLVAEDYLDADERDKAATRELVSDYFRNRIGIVVHVLSAEVGDDEDGTVPVRAELAISAGAAQVLRKMFSSLGSCWRFDFGMRKVEGEWKVASAEWTEISTDDLSSAAAGVLEELFRGK